MSVLESKADFPAAPQDFLSLTHFGSRELWPMGFGLIHFKL
jgi:hypothetical protein